MSNRRSSVSVKDIGVSQKGVVLLGLPVFNRLVNSSALTLFPEKTGATCDHAQFAKGKGCVKDLNWELGGLMRVTLNRDSPLYKGIYNQRTSCERDPQSSSNTWH